MASTYLALGGAEREQAVRQVAAALEDELRHGRVVTAAVLAELAEQHAALRSEQEDALHLAVSGIAYGRIAEYADEIADQFTARGQVEKELLAQLATAVALRQTLHTLMVELQPTAAEASDAQDTNLTA